MSDSKANFFLIGVPKAGTTSLHDTLKKHPSVFLSKEKELHYFCTDLHKSSDQLHNKKKFYPNRNLAEFQKHFEGAEGFKVIGESSTSYGYSECAVEEIFNYNPKAKILISFREPSAMLFSWHNYLLSRSDESILNFEEAYRLSSKRKENIDLIPKACINPKRLDYPSLITYDQQLINIYKFFDKNQVKVILFEELVANPQPVIKNICDFLDIDRIEIELEKSNSSRGVRYTGLKRWIDTYFLSSKKLLGRVNFIRKIYYKFIFNNKKYSKPQKFLEELKRENKPMVLRLSKLLNKDLTNIWDYEV